MKSKKITNNDTKNSTPIISAEYYEKRSERCFTIIILSLIAAFILKFFVIDFLKIKGDSMNPSIKENQIILINRLAYGLSKPFTDQYFFQWKEPKKDDIVIFLHDNKIVVKRCVLSSNEYLEIFYNSQYSNYYLNISGKHVPLNQRQYNWLKDTEKVPEGYVFVLGDNYENSIDSRDYGFVSCKNIIGRVIRKD